MELKIDRSSIGRTNIHTLSLDNQQIDSGGHIELIYKGPAHFDSQQVDVVIWYKRETIDMIPRDPPKYNYRHLIRLYLEGVHDIIQYEDSNVVSGITFDMGKISVISQSDTVKVINLKTIGLFFGYSELTGETATAKALEGHSENAHCQIYKVDGNEHLRIAKVSDKHDIIYLIRQKRNIPEREIVDQSNGSNKLWIKRINVKDHTILLELGEGLGQPAGRGNFTKEMRK